MKNIMEHAPLPHSVEGRGMIVDANGALVARMSTRLNLGDDSWRVIANKLAAAFEMEAALIRARKVIEAACRANAPDYDPNEHHAVQQIDAALAKARGETP